MLLLASLLLLVRRVQLVNECKIPNNCEKIELDTCRVTSFLQWPACAHMGTFKLRGVDIANVPACIGWLQNVSTIGEEFSAKSKKGKPTNGLGECVRNLRTPFQFGADVAEVELENVKWLDQAWFQANGKILFHGLVNRSLKDFGLAGQHLDSANLSAYLHGFSVTDELLLTSNNITLVGPTDFDSLDLSALKQLDLRDNKLCVFHLSALRNMSKLSLVMLEQNPLYVDSTTLLTWALKYPLAIAVSTSRNCSSAVANYSICAELQRANFTDSLGLHEVTLIDTNCRYTLPPVPVQAWVYALIATAATLLLAFGVASVWYASVRRRLAFAKSVADEVDALRRESNVYRDNVKDRGSGVYEKVLESVYDEVTQPPEDVYCEPNESDTQNQDQDDDAAVQYASPSSIPCNESKFVFPPVAPRTNDYAVAFNNSQDTSTLN